MHPLVSMAWRRGVEGFRATRSGGAIRRLCPNYDFLVKFNLGQ